MSASFIVASEIHAAPGRQSVLAKNWAAIGSPVGPESRQTYTAVDGHAALQLLAVDDLAALTDLQASWREEWRALAPDAATDFSRQVFEFVEAPKNCAQALPPGEWLQLRHVEVPPSVHPAYLAWRERTIFDVVRHATEVQTFLAYHSVLSSEPGVMFFSGFEGDPEAYQAVFQSARYRDIVSEAGARYITGGDKGLYTRIYRRLAA